LTHTVCALIPVLGSKPTGHILIYPAARCHYFPPGPRLPSQPESITAIRPITNYTARW